MFCTCDDEEEEEKEGPTFCSCGDMSQVKEKLGRLTIDDLYQSKPP